MGVYIKGMAMPKTKFECEFWNTDHVCTANMDGVACDPADGVYLPENCPLVEVAEPHGRLIDETRINDATVWRGGYDHRICGHIFETDAPTVIEAEGE